MPEPNAQTQVVDDGATSTGGNGAASGSQGGDGLPEYVKELRGEAASRRVENKELKATVATLSAKLEALGQPAVKPETGASGRPAEGGDAAAVQLSETRAHLQEAKQRIEALEKRDKEREEMATKKLLRASLTKTLTEAKVLDIDAAVVFLEARGARLSADDRAVLDVTDEGGESQTIVIQGEALRKHRVLTDHWFPPAGVGGSGSAAPRSAPAGVDLERAKTDPKYYAEHEKEVLNHLRGQGTR